MNVQKVFEALSEEHRRNILHLLKQGPMTVGQIQTHFAITGASLSHHLRKLKEADLVIVKKQGQNRVYQIHTTVFEDMATVIFDFFQK